MKSRARRPRVLDFRADGGEAEAEDEEPPAPPDLRREAPDALETLGHMERAGRRERALAAAKGDFSRPCGRSSASAAARRGGPDLGRGDGRAGGRRRRLARRRPVARRARRGQLASGVRPLPRGALQQGGQRSGVTPRTSERLP